MQRVAFLSRGPHPLCRLLPYREYESPAADPKNMYGIGTKMYLRGGTVRGLVRQRLQQMHAHSVPAAHEHACMRCLTDMIPVSMGHQLDHSTHPSSCNSRPVENMSASTRILWAESSGGRHAYIAVQKRRRVLLSGPRQAPHRESQPAEISRPVQATATRRDANTVQASVVFDSHCDASGSGVERRVSGCIATARARVQRGAGRGASNIQP
eukprot:365009-Chlamydomonas_euryale.AAC.8